MSYTNQRPKKLYDGSTLIPISVAKEILDIREDIEKNVQHAGPNLEIVYQAYSEIQKATGKQPRKLDSTCSGCTQEMNNLLKNWFVKYDQGSLPEKQFTGAIKPRPLKPVAQKTESLPHTTKAATVKKIKPVEESEPQSNFDDISGMNYGELLAKFHSVASEEEIATINNGKKPSKKQLIDYLNNN